MNHGADHTYENTRRIVYGEGWTFVPVCPVCGRFVKADASVRVHWLTERIAAEPNATCAKCDRVAMPCEGCM